MKIISKLYFNLFKNLGNLRLLFVSCCICGGISLFIVTTAAFDKVYYYHIDLNTVSPEWSPPTKVPWGDDYDKIIEVQSILPVISICREKGTKEALAYANYSYISNANTKVYPNAFHGEVSFETIDSFCQSVKEGRLIQFSIYSFSYLWNFLWVVFWFYLPFLIVAPIKFICDGYAQDKRNKK